MPSGEDLARWGEKPSFAWSQSWSDVAEGPEFEEFWEELSGDLNSTTFLRDEKKLVPPMTSRWERHRSAATVAWLKV